MNGFLDQVAADLLRRYGDGESGDSDNGSGDPSRKGNDGGGSSNPSGKGGKGGELSSLHIMLPSRRAGLFFGEALSALIERPIWQPTAITIDTLAEELSGGLAVGDRLRLVVELYKIYAEFHPTETFDGFWFWGELLLGDFDSIDKYLVDADTLFSNLVDLHELDSRFDYLTDGQRAVIEKFWSTFGRTGATDRSGEAGRFGEADRSGTTGDRAAENGDDGNGYGATDRSRATDTESAGSSGGERIFSPEQTDFLRVWRTLAPIYHRFRARLRELGIAYAGMVYREAAERIARGEAPQIPRRHYVIAGFNALSACERAIFEHLQKNFEVDFYWDHDLYYTGDGSLARAQEAGRFMRDNLRRFPPVAPLSGGFDNFSKPKRIRSVSAGSDVLQCKYAGMRLAEMARPNGGSGAGSVGGTADGSVESGAGGAGGAGDGSVESGAGSVSGAGDGSVESGAGGAGGAGDGSDESAKKIGRETAIVLADEGLLTPLLWSVPPEVDAVNITMGYPLRMHPAYTFVERLLELQNRRRTSRNSTAFHHSDVEGLLRHPFLGA
ncbi:MAG: hypothetical protein LBU97_04900, partial [Alistipes sp.]|nr:hypothetical protein [Alistipes sp.]